jgi:hypothetical protein
MLVITTATCLLVAGCAARSYPTPPVAAFAPAPLEQDADRHGFKTGKEDGTRDAAYGIGYHPKRDRNYIETVGYDPLSGSYELYRDFFRSAYLRGYETGFYPR